MADAGYFLINLREIWPRSQVVPMDSACLKLMMQRHWESGCNLDCLAGTWSVPCSCLSFTSERGRGFTSPRKEQRDVFALPEKDTCQICFCNFWIKRYGKVRRWAPAQTSFLFNFWLLRLLFDGESGARVNLFELADGAWRLQGCSCGIVLLAPVFLLSEQTGGSVSMWRTAV